VGYEKARPARVFFQVVRQLPGRSSVGLICLTPQPKLTSSEFAKLVNSSTTFMRLIALPLERTTL
jgi:hypothetical protein